MSSMVESWMSDYQARAPGLSGSCAPWLAALRRRAIDRFVDEGWPTTKHNDWRHTSLSALEQESFIASPAVASPKAQIEQLRADDAGHWIVFVDGRHDPSLSDIGPLPAGAEIASLAAILESRPEAAEPYFGKPEDGATPSALNMAMASDGAFIRLAAGVGIEQPIHIVFIAVTAQGACFPRNLIIADARSRATVIEHYTGNTPSATLTNVVTRTVVGAEAHITHIKLQQESENAFHIAAIDAMQEQGSVYHSHSMSFGARLARNDISTRFNGLHCETLLNGLYYVDGRRHVDHHTLIDHACPHGSSREFYRGILDGAARGVFGGRILVAPDADRTDAQQRTDSLLLSRMAKADARPELEIYAEDVKCAHGATIGQLDENNLFYLRTRGLDEAHARGLLTYAFAAEALQRIEWEPVRKRAALAIRALLPGGLPLGELA